MSCTAYAFYDKVSSLHRLTKGTDGRFISGSNLRNGTPVPKTGAIHLMAIAFSGDSVFFDEIRLYERTDWAFTLRPQHLSKADLNNQLAYFDDFGIENSIKEDLQLARELKREEERQAGLNKEAKAILGLEMLCFPCCYDDGELLFEEYCSELSRIRWTEGSSGSSLRSATLLLGLDGAMGARSQCIA